MSRCWLVKSEPESYSIERLATDGRTSWEGVRNYQARNFMRDDMRIGDRVLFYHSSAEPPAVVGLARVARTAYPDPTARDPDSPYFDPRASDDDPRWVMVDLEFVARFPEPIPLAALRQTPGLDAMPLLNKSRLSVQPLTDEEYAIIERLGAAGPTAR